LHYLNKSYQRE